SHTYSFAPIQAITSCASIYRYHAAARRGTFGQEPNSLIASNWALTLLGIGVFAISSQTYSLLHQRMVPLGCNAILNIVLSPLHSAHIASCSQQCNILLYIAPDQCLIYEVYK